MQLLLASVALLAGDSVLAQTRAVEQANYTLGGSASDNRTTNSASIDTMRIHLRGTLPVGDYFGAAVQAGYTDSTVRTRKLLNGGTSTGSRISCGFDGTDADVALFARRPTLGRIAVSYGAGRMSSDCGPGSRFLEGRNDKLRTDHYRIDAEAYWRDFSFAAALITTKLDNGPKLESTELGASWYPLDSLRVRVSGNDLYDRKTYGIELEHQPEFLGDSLGMSLGYTSTDGEPRMRTIGIGFAYHFGTQVPLKIRDRQYR